VDILHSLGTDLNDFFSDLEDEQIVFKKNDYIVKVIINYIMKNPHEGEEFGYVIRGSIDIHIGSKAYNFKKGESFYFSASKKHYITNRGNTPSEIIWVSSPPSF
jgi:mannose-6-phosphate isomerase-like protein (cupin superfamily)